MKPLSYLAALLTFATIALTSASAQSAKPKMATDIPPEITTPDTVETRIGTLKFLDGFPDDATIQKVYDNLDFERGVQAFLSGIPGASLVGMRTGFQKLGAINGTILIFENLLDSKSLFLTGNTDSVYFSTWLDLKDGPLVLETPPNVLAFLNDFWFQYITDLGNAGPDKGQGGKYLLLPPGYQGEVPEGYFVARSRTFGVWLMGRGFKVNGDLKPGLESIGSQYAAAFVDSEGKPTAPQGHESNWVQTIPGKGWNVLVRLYGPLEPCFDKTWQPGEFELVE